MTISSFIRFCETQMALEWQTWLPLGSDVPKGNIYFSFTGFPLERFL